MARTTAQPWLACHPSEHDKTLTYDGQPTRTGSNILRFLVIVTIAWVAYWAATGGLDEIPIVETAPATTSTTVAG